MVSAIQAEQFASDNYSGICPEALEYLLKANAGSAIAYGNDDWTQLACDHFRELFETDCEVFFVANGTAANALALTALCQPHQSVICHEFAHIETSECGAPEFFLRGGKLLLAQGQNGKLTPELIEAVITRKVVRGYPKPAAISITQTTEVGTVYELDELAAIGAIAQQYQLKVHMDGARFANAVAALNKTPAELTWKSGVDVLCFSGTKNGLAFGDVVLFFNQLLAKDFGDRCKQAGQVVSKMRFLAAPWLGLLTTGAWLSNARHANHCAAYLEQLLRPIEGADLLFPRQANAILVKLPESIIADLRQKGWQFYTFIGAEGVRFMCSWNTTTARIDDLVNDIQSALRK